MKGSPIAQYPIPNKLAEHVIEPGGARLAAWRGVGNGHNAFAAECFLDEIAKELWKDPIAFRLELSEGQPRMQHAAARRRGDVGLAAQARRPRRSASPPW